MEKPVKHQLPAQVAVLDACLTRYREWISDPKVDLDQTGCQSTSMRFGHFLVEIGVFRVTDPAGRSFHRLMVSCYQYGGLQHGWMRFYRINPRTYELTND
jgi:hypothetical protein